MFSIHYKKNNNSELFRDISNTRLLQNAQNYIPIYNLFFNLDENTFNKINLNHKYCINKITNLYSESSDKYNNVDHLGEYTTKKHTVETICVDASHNQYKKKCFVKYSPLLDASKYMIGKYKKNKKIDKLPELLNNENCFDKLLDTNNSAYTDSFFSYLTSQLLNQHKFVHGLDFYGSFVGIKPKFHYNVTDDLEFLQDSKFFHQNNDELFTLSEPIEKYCNDTSRKFKSKLVLNGGNDGKDANNSPKEKLNDILCNIEDLNNNFDKIFNLTEKNINLHNELLDSQVTEVDFELDNIENEKENESDNNIVMDNSSSKLTQINSENDSKNSSCSESSSDCSSRSSNTEESGGEEGEEGEEDDDEDDEDEDGSEISGSYESFSSIEDVEGLEKEVFADINNFPVQMICLEALEHTLDICLEEDEFQLTDKEWASCFFQIIMTLITYQKTFKFTHNDLHTNNVMFYKTTRKFLHYKFNDVYYRVPTYGKIYKIIDFGRAIYTFKSKIICSDSFEKNGDAATQYNFGPFYNNDKPRLLPNFSFDLCRLACSLYDYFIDDEDDPTDIKNPICKLVSEWCEDDKKRNVLYKKNGEERYPDFKLYKMIARTVNNHTPENQLKRPMFQKYKVSRSSLNKKTKIFNIDKLPKYYM